MKIFIKGPTLTNITIPKNVDIITLCKQRENFYRNHQKICLFFYNKDGEIISRLRHLLTVTKKELTRKLKW